MTVNWGKQHHVVEKSAAQKATEWAKAHQELVAVSFIVLLLLGVGVPYYITSQAKSENDAKGVLNLGQCSSLP